MGAYPLIPSLESPLRRELLNHLASSDLRVRELVERTRAPLNLVSYHLHCLKDAGLVRRRRSSADRRDLYYSLDVRALQDGFLALGARLHPTLHLRRINLPKAAPAGRARSRVLFLCLHNSARSQMAEALLRQRSGGGLQAFSAGTHPTGIHPLAIEQLRARKASTRGLRSKPLGEFAGHRFDIVITVCDRAREECPAFPAPVETHHWSIPDPAEAGGRLALRRQAFAQVGEELEARIEAFWIGESWRVKGGPPGRA